MQRSTTQVLYRYLPGAIFAHDDGFYARVQRIDGRRVSGEINQTVLLDELANELNRWHRDQIGLPNPRTNGDEFVFIRPEEVVWDVFPLTFECVNSACGRVRRWWQQNQLANDTKETGKLRCQHCSSKMRQLRYLTAHNCGAMDALHTPSCSTCKNPADMYLEDLGSFRASSWRCRTCGYAQSTRFTPCDCGRYANGSKQPYRQGYTARDQRLWYPHGLTILNISSNQTYDNLQRSNNRGIVALASWLGDQENLAASLTDLSQPATGPRMSAEEWAETEAKLRKSGINEQTIEAVRARQAPVTVGPPAIMTDASIDVIAMAGERSMVERAGLFDRHVVPDRRSFADVVATSSGTAAVAASAVSKAIAALGIEDISVTQSFPIVTASYGYSRAVREPGQAHLRTYATSRQYGNKTPIFAVPANTEALLITFNAKVILGFLQHDGLWAGRTPATLRDAKLKIAEILADRKSEDRNGPVIRRLVHSASHALLRALDDGQAGFGESSLAEWIVPNALTSAIYVGSYADFTLGAFDTVQRRRIGPWLERAAEAINHCDNDPFCSHTSTLRPHAACDRCLYMSYGCRVWNADLDRKLLRRFWLWTRQQAATR
ncbi:hypothetical protein ACFYUD_31465 [Nocardia tengchongensis]|uniref:hypothetical protein n=1 Tax=Nocardia tengchongensis TaxID=2055889 RepID=UPI0036BE8B8B